MTFAAADPVSSGRPYPVVKVGDRTPTSLADFVGHLAVVIDCGARQQVADRLCYPVRVRRPSDHRRSRLTCALAAVPPLDILVPLIDRDTPVRVHLRRQPPADGLIR